MSDINELVFTERKSNEEINNIYNFNVRAFADSQAFDWSEQNIKNEIKDGWHLYSVEYDGDIVAVAFIKKEDQNLLTKNTPIKMDYQGNGFSHMIKDFYEEFAANNKIKTIINYCPSDSFRMIALNERHHYTKTGNLLPEDIVEWKKILIK